MLATTDVTQVTAAIADLLAAGVSQDELLHQVMLAFPNLTSAELSAAKQDAQAVEKRALRSH